MRNEFSISNKENRPNLQRRMSLKYCSMTASKNMSRMSIPARRDSIVTASLPSPFNQTPALIQRESRPSIVSCTSIQMTKHPKKQTILTNLIRKLDHEQQLKQIIHSKIKTSKDRDYINYYESYSSADDVQNRLRNCQDEIESYKHLIERLMEKISCLEHREQPRNDSKLIEASTQTQNMSTQADTSLDFIDNLDKTLKILSGKKGK